MSETLIFSHDRKISKHNKIPIYFPWDDPETLFSPQTRIFIINNIWQSLKPTFTLNELVHLIGVEKHINEWGLKKIANSIPKKMHTCRHGSYINDVDGIHIIIKKLVDLLYRRQRSLLRIHKWWRF